MATMADAYANFLHSTTERFRQQSRPSQVGEFSGVQRSLMRSYSQETFVDLTEDYIALHNDRRHLSLSRGEHLTSSSRSSPPAEFT